MGKSQRDTDRIEALIRLAKDEAEVPQAVEQRVFATVETEWKTMVAQRRRRRRRLWTSVAAASIVMALWVGYALLGDRAFLQPTRVARIELVSAPLQATTDGSVIAAIAGTDLPPGTRVKTSSGRASLRLDGGQTIRLDLGTDVVFHSARRLSIQRGALYLDSGPDTSNAAPIEVSTPLGRVYDIGTRYEVRIDEVSLRVRVRDGHVQIVDEHRTHQVPAGTETTVDVTGGVASVPVPSHGSVWQWTLDAAPPLDIEGESLWSFANWISHEAGWRLIASDPDVRLQAEQIRLSGSVADLTAEEALEAVVPASGLAYHLEGGALLLTRSDAAGSP